MTIRALVVDDEPLARRGIRQLLARHPDVTVIGECRNGREALEAGAGGDCDLMFLDVQMPGLDGFQVIGRWAARYPVTVFVTAYQEFAVRAFEAAALDYLVKPVSQHRFDAAMLRARERLRLGESEILARRLAAMLESRKPGPGAIMVPTRTGRVALDLDEIDWIEARDYYSCIHAGPRRFLVRESMQSLERRLDARFVRVHRGAIVRLAGIRELRSAPPGALVVLTSGDRIPVSRRRRELLNRSLRKFHRSL